MQWETHEISNQAAELKDYNLYLSDPLLQDAVRRGGAGWHADALAGQGALLGSEAVIRMGELANRHPPELHTHSRTGERIDVVEFHPSWHEFLAITRRHGLVSQPFTEQRAGAWTAYAASQYMHNQIEAGSFCPASMTFACIPVLQQEPALFAQLEPLLFANEHDARDIPAAAKKSIMVGMGMTEKQGGTDVRSNTTRATHSGGAAGRGGEYSIVGHKWFFSAPMCDAHLVLARTDAGLSCFYVPRWRPDGGKNPIHIQRLKDKLGNRSNSSCEVEFHGAWGVMVGEEGRGIPTIIEMATNTRLHNSISSAAFMRQALVQALNHTRQRKAFGRTLIEQPLMRSVLADMALESEAALRVSMQLADAFGQQGEAAQAWKRIVTPAAKFWICKRAVEMAGEAMEVFGGNGYVEDGPMARLFREAPVNSIWEGSGNVMCLDVLRAIARHPDSMQILLDDLQRRAGDEVSLHAEIAGLRDALRQPPEQLEAGARRYTQKLMLAAQAVLMCESASQASAEAFLATRYDSEWGRVFGAVDARGHGSAVLAQAWQA